MNRLKQFQTVLCVGIGWAFLATWADLFGHSPGFALPYPGLETLGNMRIYWLLGLLALAVLMTAAPQWFERAKQYLFFCFPILASFGTMAFAIAGQQSFFPAEVLAIAGIVAAGAGYTWFICIFCTILAQTQRTSYAIASVIAGLALKTIFVQICTGILSESLQVGFAILLPFVICGMAFFGQQGPDTRCEKDAKKSFADTAAGYRYLIPQLIVAAIAVATTRVITPLGFFGDPLNLYQGAIPAALGSIGVCFVLVAMGYLTLIRRANIHLNTRFMPAFLVIILTFFVSGFSPSYQGPLAASAEIFITAAEALSHALFWTVAITTIRLKGASPFRVVGLSTGFYDILSIIWIAAFFSLGIVNNAIILLVAFLLVSLIIWLIDRGGHENEVVPPGMQADRRAEIAERYGLSPRETEVFMMLAQGRSRSYISEELVLSEGTIKTHISHIYTKLDVTNRQEMFDMLLEDDSDT